MSKIACDGDQDGVRRYRLTASQGSGGVMVTVDLRKGRHFDRNFDFNVKYDGLQPTLHNWLAQDKEYNFREGLLNLWIDGMPLKSIAALSGMRTSDLSKKLKSQKEMYFERCKANHAKIDAILERKDPEYDYMVYQKTVVNELCALLMGGDEIKDVLVQLSNLGETE
jgi:hypothetical protein